MKTQDTMKRRFGLKRLILTVATLALAIYPVMETGESKADVYEQGQVVVVPQNYKVTGIYYQGKKPIALVRPMRSDEVPETWILKPLDDLNGDEAQLAAAPAVVIRESTNRIEK